MTSIWAVPWVIPVIAGCAVGMVAIIMNTVASMVRGTSENGLKKRMIDQGFSAADIERVLCATSEQCPQCGHEYPAEKSVPTKPPKHRVGAV